MNEPEQTQAAIEASRQGAEDYSCELPCIIARLDGIAKLMCTSCMVHPDEFSSQAANHEGLTGIGMLIEDIVAQLREVNRGLYGD